MSDLLAQIKEWQEKMAALPEPLAYIVLDHTIPLGHRPGLSGIVKERDGYGRMYVRISPAWLDGVKHLKREASLNPLASPASIARDLTGVPLYKREQMPEGWPYLEPSP